MSLCKIVHYWFDKQSCSCYLYASNWFKNVRLFTLLGSQWWLLAGTSLTQWRFVPEQDEGTASVHRALALLARRKEDAVHGTFSSNIPHMCQASSSVIYANHFRRKQGRSLLHVLPQTTRRTGFNNSAHTDASMVPVHTGLKWEDTVRIVVRFASVN